MIRWAEEWTKKAQEHDKMLKNVESTVRSMLSSSSGEVNFNDVIKRVKSNDEDHASKYDRQCVIKLLKEVEAAQKTSFFLADDPNDPDVISQLTD